MRVLLGSVGAIRAAESDATLNVAALCRCTHVMTEHQAWQTDREQVEILCPLCPCRLDVTLGPELVVTEYDVEQDLPEPYQLPPATGPERCASCGVEADKTLVFRGPPELHIGVAERLGVPIPSDALPRMRTTAAGREDGHVCVCLIICEPCSVGKLGVMPVPRNQQRIIPLTDLP